VTCHQDAAELPHPKPPGRVGLEPCTICHEDTVDAFRHGVHAAAAEPGATDGVGTCGGCHLDVHAVKPHTDPASPTHWTRQATTCARCHANRAIVDHYKIPIVRPVEAYLQSAHARAVAEGKRGAVCADCHGAHDVRPSSDPASPIAKANVASTCGHCHGEILAAYQESVHGVALARGVLDAPTCTDCHGEHRILGPGEPASPVFAANIPGETCGRCHADARLSEKYGIPVGNVAAFQDSFHGLALRGGKVTVANCSSCHGVHDIRPSSDPRSHVNAANLPETCGKCHPGAGARFGVGPVHRTTASAGVVAASWIRWVYLWLIGLTIGGMGVHNLLDLTRKARTPPPPAPPVSGGSLRMSRALRWQHGMIMVSFPVLVYTGFALVYPGGWWSAPLSSLEARFALRGTLHRAAAVVMVAALVWHLIHLAVSPRLRACFRGLVPAWRDVGVLGGTLAWYLGRRSAPPPSGRFNYAEKAEYWAFLWGSVLMTVTGLPLWFSTFTLATLPAWVPDVATALHFYEAVLATLAIVVWHFYWVIFDPLVYPMDWTWWDGQPPPARVHEREEGDEEPTPAVHERAKPEPPTS
jgi:cytochrome b subunit of formate dehydrogenase